MCKLGKLSISLLCFMLINVLSADIVVLMWTHRRLRQHKTVLFTLCWCELTEDWNNTRRYYSPCVDVNSQKTETTQDGTIHLVLMWTHRRLRQHKAVLFTLCWCELIEDWDNTRRYYSPYLFTSKTYYELL